MGLEVDLCVTDGSDRVSVTGRATKSIERTRVAYVVDYIRVRVTRIRVRKLGTVI